MRAAMLVPWAIITVVSTRLDAFDHQGFSTRSLTEPVLATALSTGPATRRQIPAIIAMSLEDHAAPWRCCCWRACSI